MAEWLRRLIRNQLGVARGSSNLSAVVFLPRFWAHVVCTILQSVAEQRAVSTSKQSGGNVSGWMAERSKAPV